MIASNERGGNGQCSAEPFEFTLCSVHAAESSVNSAFFKELRKNHCGFTMVVYYKIFESINISNTIGSKSNSTLLFLYQGKSEGELGLNYFLGKFWANSTAMSQLY